MKTFIKVIGIVFAILILIVILSSMGTNNVENPANKTEEKIINKPVEKEETPIVKQKLSLDELYEKIILGMTEVQVTEIAGEADMVSEANIQGLGTAKNLVYLSGIDNLTISIQNGVVKVMVLGKMIDGKLTTKSKM